MHASSSLHIPVAPRIDATSARKLSVARLRSSQSGIRAPRHELALSVPMSKVRKAGYTVVDGDVFDIQRFAKRHPGGSFITSLIGHDGTFALENAHGKTANMRKMLGRFYVGPFAEETRDPLDRDFLKLRDQLRAEGFFTYTRARWAFDLARWFVLFTLGFVAMHWSHVAAFLLLLAGTIDVVWWIHDAGHDAIFANEARSRKVIDRLGVLVLGMPQQGYHYLVHRMHHGFVNVVGVDGALDTGPLSWTEESAAKKPAIYRRGRIFQWFAGIIPAAGPALLYSAVAYSVQKKQRALVAAIALRWIAVIALAIWLHAPSILVLPWVAGSILAFMAGLNHFHLEMSTDSQTPYVRTVFERTQNIERAGLFWHWLSGGLDLHIEHHLFPTMASHRYREIAPRVRRLAAKHGVPYRVTSRGGAILNLVRTLMSPLPRTSPEDQMSIPQPVVQVQVQKTRHGLVETLSAAVVRGSAVFLPVLVLAGILRGGAWSFAGVYVVFGLLTVVEIVLAVSGAGALSKPGQSEVAFLDFAPRAQLWIYAFGHLLVVPLVLALVARGRLTMLEMIGAGLSLASMGGTVGGLGGHELMHKRTRFDRVLGIGLYATANYGHFIASHVGGHHVNVGRRSDWGTSRRGESIYGFLYRAVVHGFLGGLRIEGDKLRKKGRAPYSLRNFVVQYALGTAVVWIALGVFGGARTLAFFALTSIVTVSFMELFNYISHYALVRPEASLGATPIAPEHTWESNNKVVNWFIFNAGMHMHHHQKPAHGFEALTLFHEKEYIPYGIAGMAILSFASPLYLRKMDRILRKREGQARDASQPRGMATGLVRA